MIMIRVLINQFVQVRIEVLAIHAFEVSARDDVPQVADDRVDEERLAHVVPIEPPRIRGALANDFKNSAREFLDRANAVILHEAPGGPEWQSVSLKPVAERPVFRIKPPEYVTPEIVKFVFSCLSEKISANRELRAKSQELKTRS